MRRLSWWVALFPALLLGAAEARAQVHLGPQISIGADSGFGLGGRLGFPLRTGLLGIDGIIDANYYFGGGSAVDSWIDTNANIRLPIPLAQDFSTRLGAGINFTFISLDTPGVTTRTSTDVGFNILGAIEFTRSVMSPFLEVRVVAGGAEQVVLSGGITFGSRSSGD